MKILDRSAELIVTIETSKDTRTMLTDSFPLYLLLTMNILTKKFFYYPDDINLFKVNYGNTRTVCEVYSKLTIKTPEQRQ